MDFFRGAESEGCGMLAGAVAVANFYGFLLRRLTLTTASPLKMLLAAPGRRANFPGISAKLVRICEITGNFHRCKIFFQEIEYFFDEVRYGGNGGESRSTAKMPSASASPVLLQKTLSGSWAAETGTVETCWLRNAI
jgi:hypothetical protein